MTLVDSHCHLTYEGLAERQEEILAAARARGVTAMLNISTREREWDAVIAVAETYPDVWASVGIHPHDVDAHTHIDVACLVDRSSHPRVIGIGETGLDYFYDKSDRLMQQQVFRTHIHAARQTGLPLIIHTRNAEDDTHAMLAEEMADGPFAAVLHCFTASQDLADKALALGLYISISGIVTFRNADALRDTAIAIPADRLLVETDAPFLAPVPHRGQPGQPAFVADTAAFLADLRGESFECLAKQTGDNFYRLFTKAERPGSA